MNKLESTPDEAYLDRNLAVQAFGKLAMQNGFNVGIKPDGEYSILYIDLPTGQVSWHIPLGELIHVFPEYQREWDNHSVELKRERIRWYTMGERFDIKTMPSDEFWNEAGKAVASSFLSMDERTREDVQSCEWNKEARSGGFPCLGEPREYLTEAGTSLVLCDVHSAQYTAIMKHLGIGVSRTDEGIKQ